MLTPESHDTTALTHVTSQSTGPFNLIPLLLVPSGCAALIFQVTWVRLLGLSMGSTSAAVSTVLTAFFLGMAIGSYCAGKISYRRHLLPFLALELAIGVFGLLLLPVLLNLDHAMALLGEPGTSLTVKFLTCVVVLAIPTVCMGATFPALAAAWIRPQSDLGSDIGRLYALNTIGAVFGALLSGFVLIPRLGIDGAVYVACALNVFVVLSGLLLHKKIAAPDWRWADDTNTPVSVKAHPAGSNPVGRRVTMVLFTTGFVSIACEVAWTKYLAIFTGATIYGFAAILGIFLIGIAAGSWAVKRYLLKAGTSPVTLVWGLVAMTAALLFARVGLAQLPALPEWPGSLDASDLTAQGLKYFAVLVVLLPATFIFGGLFPVTLSLYCAQMEDQGAAIGRGYAINTAGSILGSLAAGFWIIPNFGTDALLTAVLIVPLVLIWLFLPTTPNMRQRAAIAILTFIMLAGSWQLPHLDYTQLITAARYRFDSDAMEGKEPRFIFLEEGKAGVISVVTYDENKAKVQNNGIQESYVGLNNNVNPPFTEVLLGLMPYLLHPDPKSVFVVGFGGGNTVRALAETGLQEITVVELEPAIINAVAATGSRNIQVFEDDRVQLRINDARNTLLVEHHSYDLIVSQPSHPWLAGAGHLFTRQFFTIAASRLNTRGIYVQWVNLFNMDATTLRSILQAYYQVFPNGFTLANTPSGDLLLFGSEDPIVFDYQKMKGRMGMPSIRHALGNANVRNPEDLLWYFGLSRQQALAAAGDIAANTDTRIVSEVRLAGMRVDPKGAEDPYALLNTHSDLDVLDYLHPDEAEQVLYRAGRYFYRYFSTTRTRQAIARLKALDSALAERLTNDWAAWRESVRKRGRPRG